MAKAGLNIHNMVNKSRGEMAYTLVDVDSPVAAGRDRCDRGDHGVLSVRYVPADPNGRQTRLLPGMSPRN